MIIYLFLIERVRIVRGSTRSSRLKDKIYLLNMCGLLPYWAVGVLAIIFRVNELDESGRCLIGVERQTSILVIVYDLFINVRTPVFVHKPMIFKGLSDNSIPIANSGAVFLPARTTFTAEKSGSSYF